MAVVLHSVPMVLAAPLRAMLRLQLAETDTIMGLGPGHLMAEEMLLPQFKLARLGMVLSPVGVVLVFNIQQAANSPPSLVVVVVVGMRYLHICPHKFPLEYQAPLLLVQEVLPARQGAGHTAGQGA